MKKGFLAVVMSFLGRIPWSVLIPATLLLGLAPFRPEPHLWEKLRLLAAGQLLRLVDLFDLFLHGGPLLLVLGKVLAARLDPERDRTSG